MSSPDANVLGRGLLPPHVEARLVARGIVYAELVPRANGRGWRLTTSARPFDVALAAALGDAAQILVGSSLITT